MQCSLCSVGPKRSGYADVGTVGIVGHVCTNHIPADPSGSLNASVFDPRYINKKHDSY